MAQTANIDLPFQLDNPSQIVYRFNSLPTPVPLLTAHGPALFRLPTAPLSNTRAQVYGTDCMDPKGVRLLVTMTRKLRCIQSLRHQSSIVYKVQSLQQCSLVLIPLIGCTLAPLSSLSCLPPPTTQTPLFFAHTSAYSGSIHPIPFASSYLITNVSPSTTSCSVQRRRSLRHH